MAVFSVNQARQFYVHTGALAASDNTPGKGGFKVNNDKLYYISYNVDGEPQRSDIVPVCNIDWVRFSNGSTPKARKFTVEINDDILNDDGKVPAGYEFTLKLIFTQFIGISDADRLVKLGSVYTNKDMEKAEFLEALGESLKMNLYKESNIWPLVKVDNSGKLELTEVAQEWSRGTLSGEVLHFTPHCNVVTIEGVENYWAKLNDAGFIDYELVDAVDGKTGETVKSGRKAADLEYFCMGERADIYRGIGWPNCIETRYMVDPTKDYQYLDIQYHYKGDSEDIQHSNKTLTIVGESSVMSTLFNSFKSTLGDLAESVDIVDATK